MMDALLLDNYDSFTYNLADYFSQLNFPCDVIRNDEMSLDEFIALQPKAIVFSPGPEIPSKAGMMMELIRQFHNKIPLLGICLGHQGIGEFYGARLTKAPKPMHGKTSFLYHSGHPIFKNLANPVEVMRYHSLIIDDIKNAPLEIIATTPENEIMAFVHREFKVCGLQFHPESILTIHGKTILKNWLSWAALD